LFSAAVAGLCVLIATGLGLIEVTLAAESAQFRRRVPEDDVRSELSDLELESLLVAGERLAQRRADDAELHAALARLHFYRYRLLAAKSLDAAAPERWSAGARWERTSPQSLFATLARYHQIGATGAQARFRDSPAVTGHFGPMSEHLTIARRSCPILPHLGLFEAISELLAEGDPALPLHREAALSPASVKLLHSLARSAEIIDDQELFEVCLRRCLWLDSANTRIYVETARRRMSEPQIVERLLPAAPGPLLDFTEAALSAAGRAQAIDRATQLLDSSTLPEGDKLWQRGRIALLQGSSAEARDLLRQSVEAAPLDPYRRLDYARALHAQRDSAAARDEVAAARRLAPVDRRLQMLAKQLDEALASPGR
jgi:hypothetical protein